MVDKNSRKPDEAEQAVREAAEMLLVAGARPREVAELLFMYAADVIVGENISHTDMNQLYRDAFDRAEQDVKTAQGGGNALLVGIEPMAQILDAHDAYTLASLRDEPVGQTIIKYHDNKGQAAVPRMAKILINAAADTATGAGLRHQEFDEMFVYAVADAKRIPVVVAASGSEQSFKNLMRTLKSDEPQPDPDFGEDDGFDPEGLDR